jgi:periplasmic protein TonB
VSTAEIYLDGAWTTQHVERPPMAPTLDVRPLRHRDPLLCAAAIEAVTVAGPVANPIKRTRWPHWTIALSLSLHAAVALAALVLPATPPLLLDGAISVEIVGGESIAGPPSMAMQSAQPATPIHRLSERALPESGAMRAVAPPLEMPQPLAIDQTALQARPSPEQPAPEPIVEQTLPAAPLDPQPVVEPVPAPTPLPKPAPPRPKPVKLKPTQAPQTDATATAPSAASSSGANAPAPGHDQTPAAALRPAAAAGGGASQGERGASLVHKPSITYPRRAQRRGLEGVVEIRMAIGTDGQPTAVSLEKSSGVRDLDDAGLAAAWLYRFQPALRGGIAVPWEFVQPIEFKLHAAR